MKGSHVGNRENAGLLLRPLVILAVGVLLSVSPLPAFASSTGTGGGQSATPPMPKASSISVSGYGYQDHQSALDLYRQRAESATATIKSDIDRQRNSADAALDQIQTSATRIEQQSPQETGTKNSIALWRLKEEARTLKAQLPIQARALRGQWDAAIKSAVLQASDALEKADAQHIETDSQRAKHRKEVRKLLHKQRKETLALLEDIWKDNARQIRTRIAQAIKSLNKAIAAEQAKERGPIVGYRYVHHRGHSHQKPIYQNEQHRL